MSSLESRRRGLGSAVLVVLTVSCGDSSVQPDASVADDGGVTDTGGADGGSVCLSARSCGPITDGAWVAEGLCFEALATRFEAHCDEASFEATNATVVGTMSTEGDTYELALQIGYHGHFLRPTSCVPAVPCGDFAATLEGFAENVSCVGTQADCTCDFDITDVIEVTGTASTSPAGDTIINEGGDWRVCSAAGHRLLEVTPDGAGPDIWLSPQAR